MPTARARRFQRKLQAAIPDAKQQACFKCFKQAFNFLKNIILNELEAGKSGCSFDWSFYFLISDVDDFWQILDEYSFLLLYSCKFLCLQPW